MTHNIIELLQVQAQNFRDKGIKLLVTTNLITEGIACLKSAAMIDETIEVIVDGQIDDFTNEGALQEDIGPAYQQPIVDAVEDRYQQIVAEFSK